MKQLLAIPAVMLLTACGASTKVQSPENDSGIVQAPQPAAASPVQYARLRALVYKTSVPCPDKVAISLNSSRTSVLSYPAPSDVSAASAPLPLADGWWLDRRGLGPDPAFIDMTYEQYATLPAAPSPAELMKMILPGVRVTETRRLDMTPQEAAADTAAVNALLK